MAPQERDRRRERRVIPVSADVQPGWYLSVISLATFGNTMGNVGQGVRVQTIRDQTAREQMLQRINNQYFAENSSNNESDHDHCRAASRQTRTVRFDLGDQLPPEYRHVTMAPSHENQTDGEGSLADLVGTLSGLRIEEMASLAGRCEAVELVSHCDTEETAIGSMGEADWAPDQSTPTDTSRDLQGGDIALGSRHESLASGDNHSEALRKD